MMLRDSSPDSIREQYESDVHWEQARRQHRWSTVGLILLAGALAGAAWYVYPILKQHDASLTQLPEVRKEISSLGEQALATDAKLTDWSARQEELRGQLSKARGEMMARIDSARKQASDASAALVQRLRIEVSSQIASQIDGVKTRLASLEGSREGDQVQIARLQQELSQVRGQMAEQGRELASVRGQVNQNAASSDREIAGVKATQQRDRRDFDTYADKFAVKRVDFELTKNHSSQIAPGVTVGVHGTDVSYQRASGWVTAPDRHTIWLRNLKVQEPVFLTSATDGRTRELVLTRVSKNSVVGYVLVPAQDSAAVTATAAE